MINLDAWVSQFLREHGYSPEIIYDDKTKNLWEDAVAANDCIEGLPVSFYEDEYNKVIVAQEAFSLERAVRTGISMLSWMKDRISV